MINDKVLQLIPDSIQFWIKVEILASRQPIIENEIFIWEVTGYNWSIIKTEFLGGKITLYSWNIMCSRCISSVLGDEIFKHFQGEHAPGPPPPELAQRQVTRPKQKCLSVCKYFLLNKGQWTGMQKVRLANYEDWPRVVPLSLISQNLW